MGNRFLVLDRNLRQGGPTGPSGPRTGRRASLVPQASKQARCTQVSELAVDDDTFVLDMLQLFFDERLAPEQLTDELRDVAARAVYEATRASDALDRVPRPPQGVPGPAWLVSQAVQIAVRALQNRCVYEAVRVTVKARMRSEYVLARDRVSAMSVDTAARAAVSTAGLDMIAGFERCRSMPYEDAAGDCRIGYGHLVHPGPCDGTEEREFPGGLSEPRARELLRERVRAAEDVVRAVPVPLLQHQFDALVSFVVNVGAEAFEGSRLRELVRAGDLGEVAAELRLWVNGDGRPLPELVTRRAAEAALFDRGEYPGQSAVARAQALGVDLRRLEAPYVWEASTPPVDWCQIRHGIIRSAVEMQGAWLRSGNTLHGEGAAAVLPMLVQFWRDGVGMTQAQAEATAAISASDHPSQGFWSAAFISWCVRNAMPDPPPPHHGGFRFSGRHMVYIAQAARNREAADADRPFWLYDINDPAVVPRDGDILCLNRGGTHHSYASVRTTWVLKNATAEATGESHTDIVIGTHEEGGRRWMETVGGNVADTVGSRYYSLDAAGRLDDQVLLDGTPIPGAADVTQTVGSRAPIVFALIRLTACTD